MSTPGHHHDVVVVGDVLELYTDERGAAIGVILLVDTEAPCEVPVMFPAARSGVSVGDRLWVRGRLAFEPAPICAGVMDRPGDASEPGLVAEAASPNGATCPIGLAGGCPHDQVGGHFSRLRYPQPTCPDPIRCALADDAAAARRRLPDRESGDDPSAHRTGEPKGFSERLAVAGGRVPAAGGSRGRSHETLRHHAGGHTWRNGAKFIAGMR